MRARCSQERSTTTALGSARRLPCTRNSSTLWARSVGCYMSRNVAAQYIAAALSAPGSRSWRYNSIAAPSRTRRRRSAARRATTPHARQSAPTPPCRRPAPVLRPRCAAHATALLQARQVFDHTARVPTRLHCGLPRASCSGPAELHPRNGMTRPALGGCHRAA